MLDLGLPVMDGFELARRLRELWRRTAAGSSSSRSPGTGQRADKERSRAATFDAHRVKPVELAVIAALLAAYAEARPEPG